MTTGHLKAVLKEETYTENLALGVYFMCSKEFTGTHSGLPGVVAFRQEAGRAVLRSLACLPCFQAPCDGGCQGRIVKE